MLKTSPHGASLAGAAEDGALGQPSGTKSQCDLTAALQFSPTPESCDWVTILLGYKMLPGVGALQPVRLWIRMKLLEYTVYDIDGQTHSSEGKIRGSEGEWTGSWVASEGSGEFFYEWGGVEWM